MPRATPAKAAKAPSASSAAAPAVKAAPAAKAPRATAQAPAAKAAVKRPAAGVAPATELPAAPGAPDAADLSLKAHHAEKADKARKAEKPKSHKLDALQVPTGKAASAFRLADVDPGAKPYSGGKKAEDKARVAELAHEIDQLQDVFFGDQRFKLLIVLQGMDTSGKDGTVRGVFADTSPLGMRVVSWKGPTSIELAHDYLWRIHTQVPRNGEIVIFNRSHYEDVLVPVVNGSISAQVQQQRYAQLNDFERMLCENGTVILKFMLHISKDEQRQRLQERLDDPLKHWKFDVNDLTARAQWDAYQSAYEQLLRATSTPWAPWAVVPADSKTHRNLMIATLVRDKLASLGLRYPQGDPALDKLRIE